MNSQVPSPSSEAPSGPFSGSLSGPPSGPPPAPPSESSGAAAAHPVAHPVAHPAAQRRAFSVVFMIELWERFGFYGMAALMVLYMVQGLGYTDERANLSWGALSALVYALPVLGGWAGDRWLGTRRSMLAGATVLFVGYGLLALPLHGVEWLYAALALIAAGNGLFKPNAANLVRRIYENQPARIDSAFTVYYMAVNVGSTISMLATPWVGEVWGWHAAFAVSCAGLLLGLANYFWMRTALHWVGNPADARPLGARLSLWLLAGIALAAAAGVTLLTRVELADLCVAAVGVAVLVLYAVALRRAAAHERPGLLTAGVLVLEVGLYFVFYQQMSTSLTLFALRNVDPVLRVPGLPALQLLPAQFQALNPIWIMLLSPALAWLYARLARGPGDASPGLKFALGFAAVAAGFAVFAASGMAAVDGRVPAWWVVAGYGLVSLGELLISALGLAVIARYVPARLSGFLMGAFFAVSGISMYLGGLVANFAKVPAGSSMSAQQTLPLYLDLFGQLSLASVVGFGLSLILLAGLRRVSPGPRTA